MSIDALGLDQLSLIQLDVEGHELLALQGAQKTIERCAPIIMIEDNKVEGKAYRGVVNLTVRGKKKDEQFVKRLTINGPETAFRVKVPVRPVEVGLNENGGMLALDVEVKER